jgi:hypothetical protein
MQKTDSSILTVLKRENLIFILKIKIKYCTQKKTLFKKTHTHINTLT